MEENLSFNRSIVQIPVTKMNGVLDTEVTDLVAVEEPLEMRLVYGPEENRSTKNIAVTMRTPGHDADLVIGFLFTEGIIQSYDDILEASHLDPNVFVVELKPDVVPQLDHAERNFFTTSSCGICGKSSIQSIKTKSAFNGVEKPQLEIRREMLHQLYENFQQAQNDFSQTGGVHASAVFSAEGTLQLLREDVGRHNALDKLIGSALKKNLLPLNTSVLLLSGRISFELIQKACMAGIGMVVAIGAPSSLAVEFAKEMDITLIGFFKKNKFNLYHLGSQVEIFEAVDAH